MTTEKLTNEMMQAEQTAPNNESPIATPAEQTNEKPVKQKKAKRKYKTSTTLYILLTIIGVMLIGLGGAISVFELGEYKMANYRALPVDPNLPPIEMQTTTLEATYEKGAQFKLDASDWYISGGYDIQYDNSLKDKVIVEVVAPKELYDVYLITQGENHYYLNCSVDAFNAFYQTLNLAKESYILEDIPPVALKLTMSEAQAKTFKLNEERYKQQEAQQSYAAKLDEVRTEYNKQLEQIHTEYTEQLTEQQNVYDEQIHALQEEHTAQIQGMQDNYDTQIEELHQTFHTQQEEQAAQYEGRIAELEMQLNDARNALH